MLRIVLAHVRRQPVAYVALFVALGGTGVAATRVTGGDVTDGSLTSVDVLDGSLTGADLKFGSVKGVDIGSGTLTGTDIAANSLGSTDVRNGSLTSQDVRDRALTGADVRDRSLGGADLRDGSVAERDLAPGLRPSAPPPPSRPVAPGAVFAYVTAAGRVDRARSRGIASRAITHPRRGTYCVLAGRGVAPRNVMVTSVRRPAQLPAAVTFARPSRERRCANRRVRAIVTLYSRAGHHADGAFQLLLDR